MTEELQPGLPDLATLLIKFGDGVDASCQRGTVTIDGVEESVFVPYIVGKRSNLVYVNFKGITTEGEQRASEKIRNILKLPHATIVGADFSLDTLHQHMPGPSLGPQRRGTRARQKPVKPL